MMHELFLHPPAGELPRSFHDVQRVLREAETLAPYVNEEASTPEQVVLTDGDTGVWAILAPRFLGEEEEEEAEEPGVLLLQIPYGRPRFFGIEGSLFAVALQQELGYLVEDPQARDPAPRARSEEELLPSWEAGNRAALTELRESGAAPSELPTAVDANLLAQVFSHNLHRREVRIKAGPDVQIPRLMLASVALRKEPAVIGRYEAGAPLWLPQVATHLLLRREKKTWLGTKEEWVRVEADAVRALLEPWAKADEAPSGMMAYRPEAAAKDPLWKGLEGPPARETALIDWNGVVDEGA